MLHPLKPVITQGREAIAHVVFNNGSAVAIVAARGTGDWAAYYAPWSTACFTEEQMIERTARLGEKLSHDVAYAMFGHLVGEWGSYRR